MPRSGPYVRTVASTPAQRERRDSAEDRETQPENTAEKVPVLGQARGGVQAQHEATPWAGGMTRPGCAAQNPPST